MFLIDSSHDLARPRLELINDKIAPPTRKPRISRGRLLTTLEKSMAAGTSTIISGRAGTGKTSLALDFAQKCGRPVAWYKIDAPEYDGSFDEYVNQYDYRPKLSSNAVTKLLRKVA